MSHYILYIFKFSDMDPWNISLQNTDLYTSNKSKSYSILLVQKFGPTMIASVDYIMYTLTEVNDKWLWDVNCFAFTNKSLLQAYNLLLHFIPFFLRLTYKSQGYYFHFGLPVMSLFLPNVCYQWYHTLYHSSKNS